MKAKLTLIGLLAATLSFGQCDYLRKDVDEFTGKKTVLMQRQKIALSTYMAMASIDGVIGIYIYKGDYDCVTGESYIIFKFTDGTTLNLTHLSGFDCDDTPMMVLYTEDKSLWTKPVEKMRVKFSKGYRDLDCTNPYAFIENYGCL